MAISKIKSESIDLTDTGYTFGDLLVSGDLTIDTSSLTVDSTNNRVGIGTTTPSSDLHIAKSGSGIVFQTERTDADGFFTISHSQQKTYFNTEQDYIWSMNGTEAMRIDQSRNVGIGTSSPRTRLDLGSNGVSHTRWGTWSELGEESSHNSLIIGNNIYVDGSASKVRSTTVNGYRAIKMKYNTGITFHTVNASVTTNDALGYERMRIDPSGNVGIGTTSPSSTQRLTLKGDFSTIESGILFDQSGNQTVVSHADATSPSFIISNKTANGVLRFDTNSTERLRITSAGNVGIGTSSPKTFLHLLGDAPTYDFSAGTDTTASLALINDNANAGTGASIVFGSIYGGTADVANARIFAERENTGSTNAGAADLIFEVGNDTGSSLIERMRIDSSGRVGIGTSSPEVSSIISTQGSSNGLHHHYFFNASGVGVGRITCTASTTSYVTSSDYRLKENVIDLADATTRLKQLQPKRFNFIADADTTVDGFLAHEVSSIVPEAINGEKDELDADGNPVYQGIDQSKLVPLLTAALKESLTKIDELEQRISALENS